MSSSRAGDDAAEIQKRYLTQCWGVQGQYNPIGVERTDGCWIRTTDGRRIFALRSAHECINLGFRHPKVLAAMRRQMEQVVYVTDDFATQPTATLAEKLAGLAPGDPNKRVFFCQSGAALGNLVLAADEQEESRRMLLGQVDYQRARASQLFDENEALKAEASSSRAGKPNEAIDSAAFAAARAHGILRLEARSTRRSEASKGRSVPPPNRIREPKNRPTPSC